MLSEFRNAKFVGKLKMHTTWSISNLKFRGLRNISFFVARLNTVYYRLVIFGSPPKQTISISMILIMCHLCSSIGRALCTEYHGCWLESPRGVAYLFEIWYDCIPWSSQCISFHYSCISLIVRIPNGYQLMALGYPL